MAHKKKKINQRCSCNVATTQEAHPPHNKNCKCLVMLLDWLLVMQRSILCDNNISIEESLVISLYVLCMYMVLSSKAQNSSQRNISVSSENTDAEVPASLDQ